MSLFESASLVVTPNGTKASKLYAVKPTDGSGDLTATRATSATRVNSAGLIESVASNVPRLDYSNGTCPSILVEPQRTNVTTYSEQFDNVAWSKYIGNVTANATTSPSGLQNADKFIDSTDNEVHALYKAYTISGDTTFSIYVKSAEYSKIAFTNLSDGGTAKFDISNGTIISTSAQWKNSTIQNAGNGWYRIASTTNGISGSKAIGTSLLNSSNQEVFAGTGTSGIFIWGAQLEAGSYATSYIPTVASAVTRNADVISKTGIADLIGQTEGTLFCDINYLPTQSSDSGTFFSIEDWSNLELIRIYTNGTELIVQIYNNANIYLVSAGIGTIGDRYKIAVSYSANLIKVYINGSLINSTSGTFSIPTCSNARIGSFTSGQTTNASINSATLWKTTLTDTEAINLTTL